MIIMKYAVQPIIQIEGTIGTEQKVTRRKKDIPDKITRRVNLTLLPNPMAESLKCKPKSSPTILLVGVIYYQVRKNFGGGCMQTLVVNNFDLKAKNVALCITGWKYLGSKDKQSGTKWKAADDMAHESKRTHQEEDDNNED